MGTPLEGLGVREPCTRVHDDLFVRALHVSHNGREALIIGCDLLFFERREVDRFKGAIGRKLPLSPAQILLNVSHNHAGPRLTDWAYSGGADPLYLETVEAALVEAATKAQASAEEVEVRAGTTRTDLPRSRRHPAADGGVQWRPYDAGPTCDALPVCVLSARGGRTVSVLFSVSCHPSMWYEPEVSAEYPGVAQRVLNERFATEGALFLQGAGGDAKPRHVADGESRWKRGTWDDVEAAGREVADAVSARCAQGLERFEPEVRWHYEDIDWPMDPPPTREALLTIRGDASERDARRQWAAEMTARLEHFDVLPRTVPIGLHALQIARGVRLIGLEGEPVAELGLALLGAYPRGVTFPLGYTNGTQLYLTVPRMRREGGYEFDSFYEYHWPAPLADGGHELIIDALRRIQDTGVIPG